MIEAARDGDFEAWNRIDVKYRRALALAIRGRIPHEARARFDTEDVVQSTLIAAYESLPKYEYQGEGSFERWLQTILRNRLIWRLRHHSAERRSPRYEDAAPDSAENSAGRQTPSQGATPPTPLELNEQVEQSAQLLGALGALDELDYRILVLSFFDGLPMTRVAESVGLPETSTRRRAAKSIKVLAAKLGM